MVAGTVRHDSASFFFVGHAADRCDGSAELECSRFLKVLTFEEQFQAADPVERFAGQTGVR